MTFPSDATGAAHVQPLEIPAANDVLQIDSTSTSQVIIPDHVDYKRRPLKCVRFCLEVMVTIVPSECTSRLGTWRQDADRERSARQAAMAQRNLELINSTPASRRSQTAAAVTPAAAAETTTTAAAAATATTVTEEALVMPIVPDVNSIWDECLVKRSTPSKKRSRLEALYMGGSGSLKLGGGRVPQAEEIVSFVEFKHPLVKCSDVHMSTSTISTNTGLSVGLGVGMGASAALFHQNCTQAAPCSACDPKASWMEYMLAVSELECRKHALTHVSQAQAPLCW